MAQVVRDYMTKDPVRLKATDSLEKAAQAMETHDIGAVMVEDASGKICGIATDRDIVVRAVARGRNPKEVKLEEVCSQSLSTLSPSDDLKKAVEIMRKSAVRRIPVVENDKPVGIISLGDLAATLDPGSALAAVSTAPPNH